MLHHIPSPALQGRLFVELHRMLAPGGILVASDSRDLDMVRAFHQDDVFVPLDPKDLGELLTKAGFGEIEIDLTDFEVRFSAKKA